jgi:sugar phosphate isomerase/epimerase
MAGRFLPGHWSAARALLAFEERRLGEGVNRRAFLRFSGTAALLCRNLSGAASAGPAISFPREPRARLAVASYPFRKDLDPNKGSLTLLNFPQMVSDRFDVSGIEPLDEHFAHIEGAYLEKFRQALDATRTHIVNIPVGRLHGSFYDPDANKRGAAIQTAKQWVDVAATVGSPGIRVHVQRVPGLQPDVERAAASLAEVAEYGERRQVVVNLENDDPASEDAFYVIDVMERAKTPWLRALPDFCNSMLLNKGEAYNYRAVAAMFAHACTVSHVKEIETGNGKTYRIDLAKTFALAKQAGYKGYFSMEWDSDGDPYAGTKHLIAEALQALS